MSLVPRCPDCDDLVTRCCCPSNPAVRASQPLPTDPDEAMRALRGCTVAEHDALLQRWRERGAL